MRTSSGIRKYGRNAFWLFAEKFVKLISGVVIGIWVARYLGPQQYGTLMYVASFVSIFIPFSMLGVDGLFAKLYLEHDKSTGILKTSLLLKSIGAAIAFVIVNLLAFLLHYEQDVQLFIALLSSLYFFNITKVIEKLFIAELQSTFVMFATTSSILVAAVFKAYLIIQEKAVVYFVLAMVIEALSSCSIILWKYFKHSKRQNEPSDIKAYPVSSLLKQSWPLIFSATAVAIFMKMDLIMVKVLLGESDAGYYAAAIRLSEVWIFITMAITQSLFPAIFNAKKFSITLYESRLKAMFQLLILLACFIALFIATFSGEVITVLLGEEYLRAEGVLTIYIWILVFIFLNNAAWSWYLNEGLQKLVAIRLMFGAVLNIIMNAIMIPLMGIEGAAIATLVSYSLSTFWSNVLFSSTRKVFFIQKRAFVDNLKAKFDFKSIISN